MSTISSISHLDGVIKMYTGPLAKGRTRRAGALSLSAIMVIQTIMAVLLAPPMIVGADSIPSNISDMTVSGDVTYTGGSATVTGNIVVPNGAKLTLNDLNITMAGTAADSIGITVSTGGSLFIHGSNLMAFDGLKPYRFVFEDGSTGLIADSTIKNVGSPMSMSGLTVMDKASVDIRGTTISESFIGVKADGSSPTIDGCLISDGQGHGIFASNNARPIVTNTTIARFTQGMGIYLDSSDAEISSDILQQNKVGIGLYSSQSIIDETMIRSNFESGLHSEGSAPIVVGSEVLNNQGDGLFIKSSSIVLDSATVKANGGNGMTITESTVQLSDTSVEGNAMKDLAITGAVSTLPSKVVLRNTTFSTYDFSDPNPKSILEVNWYVSVEASYQSEGSPVSGATVWLSDSTGTIVTKDSTDLEGKIAPTSVMSYFIDIDGKSLRTPHVLTVEKAKEKQTTVVDLSSKGSDVKLVFDDISPWINLDPVIAVTNQASIRIGGLVATDTTSVTLNGVPATIDLAGHRFSGVADLTPGNNEIFVEAMDHVGNVNNTTVNVLMDVVPPLLQLLSPVVTSDAPIYTNIGFMTIKGQTEATADLWIDETLVGQNTNGMFEHLVQFSPGNNVVTLKAQDLAGNTASMTLVVYYDPDAPVLQLTEPKVTSTNQRNLVVSGNVNDPDSKVLVSLNHADTKVALDGMTFTLTITLIEGTNQLTVMATDRSGNTAIVTRTIVLDTIAPQLVLDSPIDGLLTTNKEVTVTGMTDETSILTVNGAGAQRDGLSFSAVVELAEGRNYIEVISRDEAGNARTIRTSVYLDSTAPLITIISPLDGLVTKATETTVEGYISEDAGVLMNGRAVSVDTDGTYFKAPLMLAEGPNRVSFEARDKAGNTGFWTLTVIRDTLVSLDGVRVDKVSKGHYVISGRTDQDATLTINGQSYPVGDGGMFRANVEAKDGSEVSIETKDPLGNLKILKVTTPKGAAGAIKFNWGPAMMGVSLIFVAVVVGLVGGTERGKLFALFFLFVPLYSRMKKNTVLDHYVRGQIHGYIVANPGDHYNSIKDALKLNNGTLAYHIRVLEKEGIVKSRTDGIYKRFYPADMKVPENDGTRLTEIQKIILKRIKETPGISQKEMSALVGVSPSTINYHIDILKSAGLMRSERRGMRVGYFLEDIAALKKAEERDKLPKKCPALDEDKKFQRDLDHHDFSAHDDGLEHAAGPGPVKKFIKKPVKTAAPVYDPKWEDKWDEDEKGDGEY